MLKWNARDNVIRKHMTVVLMISLDKLKAAINQETVLTRIKAKNISGISQSQLSPLSILDHTIVDFIIKSSQANKPLTKLGIMTLIDDMIHGTIFEKAYQSFCLERGVIKKEGGRIVGEKWYQHFMHRHSEALKRGKVRMQDIKLSTWCTVENFMSMYTRISANG
jgi:hypothetical protein